MKKWKILKEIDVSPSQWFPVFRHILELPDHSIIDDYFISSMRNAAMVFPLTTENEVVFVKQYKHGLGEILLELPAGFQQKGKSIEESALAELHEETGIKANLGNLEYLGRAANIPTKMRSITHLFLARDVSLNSSQSLDPNEDIEIIRLAPKEVLNMVERGEIWVADTISAIMKVYLKYHQIFK